MTPEYFQKLLFNLEKSSEALVSNRIDRLEDMIIINGTNFLEVYNATQKNIGEVAFANWKNKGEKREFFRNVLRKLLNYLNSSTTLIDHTRKLIRTNYLDTSIEKEYNEQIEKTFKNSSLNIFVIDLRNFFTHYAVPIISRQFNIDNENTTEIISLNKEKLLNQPYTWKKQSKEFLQTLPKEFEICSVLYQYQKLRDDFYPSFVKSLCDFHKDELNQFNKWIREWNTIVAKDFQM